jgi:hypothetical protein
MRDTHLGMPGILNACERDGFYFGVVRIVVAEETATFEFGVEHIGYTALRKVLQMHPFSNLPGIEHRYFFTGGHSRKKPGEGPVEFWIRIEQGNDARKFEFEGPITLVSNLLWFQSLTDLRQASALKRLL